MRVKIIDMAEDIRVTHTKWMLWRNEQEESTSDKGKGICEQLFYLRA